MLTQSRIDEADRPFNSRVALRYDLREVDGAEVVRMAALRAERKTKANLLGGQDPERKAVSWLDNAVKYLGLLAGALLASVVVIQVIKAVVR